MKLLSNNIISRIFNYVLDWELRILSHVLCLLDQADLCSTKTLITILAIACTKTAQNCSSIWQSFINTDSRP